MHPTFQSILDEVRGGLERTVRVLTDETLDAVQNEISVPVGYSSGPRGGLLIIRSKPGEAPRREKSDYFNSWGSSFSLTGGDVTGRIFTDHERSSWFIQGTSRMEPRPHGVLSFNQMVGRGPDVLSAELNNG
jgi:hypothetical protein